MAALIKRGRTFYVRFKLEGRRYFRSTGFTDQRRARARANEIEAEIRDGGGSRSCPTLKEWWRSYEGSYTATKGVSGKKLDRMVIPPAIAFLGPTRRLSSVAPSEVLRWRETCLKSTSPNSIRTYQSVLSAFFQAAVREGRLPANPVSGLRRPSAIPRIRTLSLDEQRSLFGVLRPQHLLPIQLLLATGLRASELLQLTATSLTPQGLQVLGKGKKRRLVPLTTPTRSLLEAWLADSSRILERQALLDALQRACKKAGIPPLTLHDLRRTFGTRCAEKLPMPRLAKIMGHSAIATTAKFYVHLDEIPGSELLERVNLLDPSKPSAEVVSISSRKR